MASGDLVPLAVLYLNDKAILSAKVCQHEIIGVRPLAIFNLNLRALTSDVEAVINAPIARIQIVELRILSRKRGGLQALLFLDSPYLFLHLF